MNGCGQYWILLDRANREQDDDKARVLFSVAYNHQRQCQECKEINAAPVVQWENGQSWVCAE